MICKLQTNQKEPKLICKLIRKIIFKAKKRTENDLQTDDKHAYSTEDTLATHSFVSSAKEVSQVGDCEQISADQNSSGTDLPDGSDFPIKEA